MVTCGEDGASESGESEGCGQRVQRGFGEVGSEQDLTSTEQSNAMRTEVSVARKQGEECQLTRRTPRNAVLQLAWGFWAKTADVHVH